MSIETLRKKVYSSSEIQRIAKISKTQAIHWTQTGVITPLQDAHGRGSRRVYSWSNLVEIMICRELNKYNIGRSLMQSIISRINKPGDRVTRFIPIKTGVSSSYWDYLNKYPKTDQVYLVIKEDSPNGFEIVMKRNLMSVTADRPSCVIVNIAALIAETEEG